MTPDQNRNRVLELVDRVVNSHEPDAISRFTSDPGIADSVRSLLTAFPDLHLDVVWTVAEADRVVAFLEMAGTHEGPWLMVQEPTHLPMRASLMLGLRFDGAGMVTDTWLGTNFIAMLAQLGWGVAPVGGTVTAPSA
jgi:predicted ester cyclase